MWLLWPKLSLFPFPVGQMELFPCLKPFFKTLEASVLQPQETEHFPYLGRNKVTYYSATGVEIEIYIF